MSKIAFVLSGGGAKGAFEAGVLKALSQKGVEPDALYGTSAGALNAAGYAFQGPDGLLSVWRGIKKKADIMTGGGVFDVIRSFLGNGKGIYSTAPLRRIIDTVLTGIPRREAVVCRVSLKSGAKDFVRTGPQKPADLGAFKDAVQESAETPILTDVLNGEWVDGGVRQMTPLKIAIDEGADEVFAVLASPYQVNPPAISGIGNIVDMIGRTFDVMAQEIFWMDVQRCDSYNKKGWGRKVRVTVFAPDRLLLDTLDFTPDKINAAIQQGLCAAPVFTTS